MAQKKIVTLVDDIDGESPAAETIRFALDGVDYDIDLSTENARVLREMFSSWATVGWKVGGKGSRRSKKPARSAQIAVDPSQAAAIRDWARRNGYEVSGRGRIPAPVMDAFHAAH